MKLFRRTVGWIGWGIAAAIVFVIAEAVKEIERRDRRP